jgi:hypothetical protein
MTRIIALALFASPASAETIREWHGVGETSYVEIHEPTAPNAVATVTFANRPVHNQDEQFVLTFDGIEVRFGMRWGYHSGRREETLTIYPPDGYIAVPPELDLDEWVTDEAQIYLWEGM